MGATCFGLPGSTEWRRLWTRGEHCTGLVVPCATGAEVKTIGFAPGGVGGSEEEG